jgi:hypothetical protein
MRAKKISGILVLLAVSIAIGILVLPKQQEKAAVKLLTELYTVTDYNYIIDLKSTEQELEQGIAAKNENIVFVDDSQYIAKASAPYKDLLTERGLQQLLVSRTITKFDRIAQESNRKFFVDKINLTNMTKADNDKYQYDFEAVINVNNEGDKIIKPKGSIVVKKENSIWKVDYLKEFNPGIWKTLEQ